MAIFCYTLNKKMMEHENTTEEMNVPENDSNSNGKYNLPYVKRLLIAALSVFSVLFTVCIYGPYEVFLMNQAFFPFLLSTLLGTMVLFSIIVLAVLSPLIALFKGKIFNILVGLVLAVSIGLYIQGSYLNINLVPLDFTAVEWELYRNHAIWNTVVWFIIIITTTLATILFTKKAWKLIVVFIPVLLIGMQAAQFVYLLIEIPEKTHYKEIGFSTENQFQLSTDSNLIVISLDHFSGDFIDILLEEYPDILDNFSDFTLFRNYSPVMGSTTVALNTMLTGFPYTTISTDEWLKKAWSSAQALAFFDELKAQNFDRRLFVSLPYVGRDPRNLDGLIDNMIPIEREIDYMTLLRKTIKLSAYRYMPHITKHRFEMEPDEFSATLISESENVWRDYYDCNNITFYTKLTNERLHTTSDRNVFTFYHLLGRAFIGHDEFVVYNPNVTEIQHIRGLLFIIEEYIAQMKELGIYDDAIIIITGDHSSGYHYPTTLLMIKRPGEAHERTIINQAPVSQIDFHPTLLFLLGINHKPFGRSVFDVAEDEIRLRTWSFRKFDPNYAKVVIYEYDFYCHVDDVSVFARDGTMPTRIVEIYPQ